MDIAIMGAGLSGLACAITLESHGVNPVIFESRDCVEDTFVCGELLLDIMNKPFNNCLDFLKDEHNISLSAIGDVKKLIVHSKGETCEIDGTLGVMNLRGRREDSFDSQLHRQVKSELVFNSKKTLDDLKSEFSKVVVATGDAGHIVEMDNFREDFTVSLKGATVKGKFKPNTCHAWFNHDFAPKGYAYLIPFSTDEANIVLAFPDHIENSEKDMELLWEKYFLEVSHNLDLNLKVTDGFQIRKYVIGICDKAKIDNTYFIGNCFGAILPFLGFGQFRAIMTGIYAAHDMLGISNYEETTKHFKTEYENSLKLRKAIEGLSNSKLDLLVKSINVFPLNNFANYSFSENSYFNLLKYISAFM